ncbi:hypothetical protein [Sphingomonas sp.]|uniref:hypothetical protein n=1 Tax=Sphingomonas sp. TaxID=28214 RepID=UPI000DB1288D|nr:hypothetical protein [Sphingomonas sp.]PZU06184.1 MAG: hypothetical protein DI605_19895 [Sphingomonas sp.]
MLLAGLALFLRILIPSGWMPASDRIGLMPCFGMAPVETTMVSHGSHHGAPHHQDHDGEKGDKPCAFAGFACALAEPADTTHAPAPLFAARTPSPATLATTMIGAGLAAPPPPQTGPPLTA